MADEPAGPPAEAGPPPATPDGRALHPAVWGLILIAAFFGAQMVAGAVVTFAWVAAGGDPGALLNGLLGTPAAGPGAGLPGLGEGWTAAVLLSGAAASAGVAIPLSVIAHRNTFGDAKGLRGRPGARPLAWGLLGFALILGVSAALEVGIRAVAGAEGVKRFDDSLQSRLTGLLARPEFLAFAIPVAGLLAPAAEELVFRGFFHRALRAWLGRGRGPRAAFWSAALLSGLAWAVVHGDPVVLPIIVAFGAVLAWVYERSGSIFAPVAAHMLYNTTTLVALAFLVKPA
ncbi:MAG: CPBP family intramembrane glutamic endopeptidase [Halobacteria archaeon]